MTTTLDDTPIAPASAAVNAATVFNHITVNVPSAAPAAAPRVAAKPLAVNRTLPKAEGAILTDKLLSGTGRAVTVTEHPERDNDGHAIMRYKDSTGAEVILKAKHGNQMEVTFMDGNRSTITTTKRNGFDGTTNYRVPERGVSQVYVQIEKAAGTNEEQAGLNWIYGRILNGDVTCDKGGKGLHRKNVSDDVIDAVTRERIQAFAKAHPELAAKVRESKEKVTILGGVPVTLEQVQNTPASFKACPENMRGHGAVVPL